MQTLAAGEALSCGAGDRGGAGGGAGGVGDDDDYFALRRPTEAQRPPNPAVCTHLSARRHEGVKKRVQRTKNDWWRMLLVPGGRRATRGREASSEAPRLSPLRRRPTEETTRVKTKPLRRAVGFLPRDGGVTSVLSGFSGCSSSSAVSRWMSVEVMMLQRVKAW